MLDREDRGDVVDAGFERAKARAQRTVDLALTTGRESAGARRGAGTVVADLALAVERSANPQDEIEARRDRVRLLLEGDDSGNANHVKIIAGSKQDLESLTKQLGASDPDDWPFVNGRFLKPDTIISVDVEPS